MGIRNYFKFLNSYDSKFPGILHSSNWKKANYNEKLNAFKQLEIYYANKQGRPARNVIPNKMDTIPGYECGYYNPNDKNIYINSDFLEKQSAKLIFMAVNTVIHEGRHAYQHDVKNNLVTCFDQDIKQNKQKWYENSNAFFSPKNGFRYVFQPMERDSREYALNETKKLYSFLEPQFGKEKKLKIFLNDIDEHLKFHDKVARTVMGDNYLQEIDNEVHENFENAKSNKRKSINKILQEIKLDKSCENIRNERKNEKER